MDNIPAKVLLCGGDVIFLYCKSIGIKFLKKMKNIDVVC